MAIEKSGREGGGERTKRGTRAQAGRWTQQPHLYLHGQANISSISFSPEKKQHSEEKQVR